MLTQENINYKWKEVKGAVRNMWGKITLEEIEAAKFNLHSLSNIARERHHETFDTFNEKMKALLDSFDNDTDKGLSEDVSSFARAPVSHKNYAKNGPSSQIQPVMDNYLPEETNSVEDSSSR